RVGGFRNKLQLNQPTCVMLDSEQTGEDTIEEFAGAIIPIYLATSRLPTWRIANSVRVALDQLSPPEEPLPPSVRANRRLVGIGQALHDIHRPPSWEALGLAKRRLKWDEAFAVQLTLVQRKVRAAGWPATPRPRRDDGLLATFNASLPYELTRGQRDVGEEIAGDLAQPHPMHRLLQGE